MYTSVLACRGNQGKCKLAELEGTGVPWKFVEILEVRCHYHNPDMREAWVVTGRTRKSPGVMSLWSQGSESLGIRKYDINQSALQMVLSPHFLPLTECRK